jgi:hypothetical protein
MENYADIDPIRLVLCPNFFPLVFYLGVAGGTGIQYFILSLHARPPSTILLSGPPGTGMLFSMILLYLWIRRQDEFSKSHCI